MGIHLLPSQALRRTGSVPSPTRPPSVLTGTETVPVAQVHKKTLVVAPGEPGGPHLVGPVWAEIPPTKGRTSTASKLLEEQVVVVHPADRGTTEKIPGEAPHLPETSGILQPEVSLGIMGHIIMTLASDKKQRTQTRWTGPKSTIGCMHTLDRPVCKSQRGTQEKRTCPHSRETLHP